MTRVGVEVLGESCVTETRLSNYNWKKERGDRKRGEEKKNDSKHSKNLYDTNEHIPVESVRVAH